MLFAIEGRRCHNGEPRLEILETLEVRGIDIKHISRALASVKAPKPAFDGDRRKTPAGAAPLDSATVMPIAFAVDRRTAALVQRPP
jgi:hypothetical protein